MQCTERCKEAAQRKKYNALRLLYAQSRVANSAADTFLAILLNNVLPTAVGKALHCRELSQNPVVDCKMPSARFTVSSLCRLTRFLRVYYILSCRFLVTLDVPDDL